MDWLAKGAWIGQVGNWGMLPTAMLKSRRINTLYFSPLDPGVTPDLLNSLRANFTVGLYSDPHWYGFQAAPIKFRVQLDADIARLLRPDDPVMVDLEQVAVKLPDGTIDPKEYVRRLFDGYPGNRGLVNSGRVDIPTGTQPNRPLSYTTMPFQDGTVVPMDVLANDNVHWYPQLYYGDMSTADNAAVVLEIARWMESSSFPNYAAKIHPFYDGKAYASDHRDGAYFTAERLPGAFGLRDRLRTARDTREMSKADLRVFYKSARL